VPYSKKKSVREKSRRLLALAKGRKRCLIFIQNNPDPDAIAAAVALARLLKQRRRINSAITFDGVIGRAENQAMVRNLKITLTPVDQVNLAEYDLTAAVDTQPGTGNNSFPAGRVPDIVIDHHPLREETKAAPFFDVKANYGATSSILVEYLYVEKVTLTRNLAAALAYGIKTDTQDLGRETSILDIDAFHYVYNHCNPRVLAEIENEKVPQEYFAILADAMRNATIYEDVIVAGLGDIQNPDMVGEIADLLLRLEHMRYALCYGFLKDQAAVSVRTIDERLDAGKLVKKMIRRSPFLRERATGGGHEMMAGAQIPYSASADGKEKEKITTALRNSFLNVIGASKLTRRRLVKKTDSIRKAEDESR
jgi:nanoRNase/pAp phosphatase (c-di-AMP/oligoRNAs hydrolase)